MAVIQSFDKKKIIFIGNSFTFFGKCVNVKTFDEVDDGYFYKLAQSFGEDVTVTNFTWGGASFWHKGDGFASRMLYEKLKELAADIIVVGRFAGQGALAGVGTCTVLVNLFLNFILGLSAGATIVLGQAIGGNSSDKIEKASHTSIAVAIWGGFIVSLICLLFTKQLLHMIDVPENVLPQAATYLRIVAVGFIPSLIYNFGAALLQYAQGTISWQQVKDVFVTRWQQESV